MDGIINQGLRSLWVALHASSESEKLGVPHSMKRERERKKKRTVLHTYDANLYSLLCGRVAR